MAARDPKQNWERDTFLVIPEEERRKYTAVLALLRGMAWVDRMRRAPFLLNSTWDPAGIRHLLLVELFRLGDLVVSTAWLEPLRQRFPNARISLLAHPLSAQLLQDCPLVDEILPLEVPWVRRVRLPGQHNLLSADYRAIYATIRRLRGRFDMVVTARGDLREHLLAYLLQAPVRVGFTPSGGDFLLTERVPFGRLGLRVADYLKVARHLGCEVAGARSRLWLDPDAEDQIERQFRAGGWLPAGDNIVVHPGASWPYKMWPLENVAEIVRRVYQRLGKRVLIPITRGEQPLVDRLQALLGQDVQPVVLYPSLPQLKSVFARSAMVLCNNSGAMHIAEALGVRAIVLSGSADHVLWSPSHATSLHLQKSRDLACYPCQERVCVTPDAPCINLITVEEVWSAVQAQLAVKEAPVPVTTDQIT